MKIYIGKNKSTARLTTLKDVIIMALAGLENEKTNLRGGRFDDNSASWVNVERKIDAINNGVRLDTCIAFDPETDNTIKSIDFFMSDKLHGYDEENMEKIE